VIVIITNTIDSFVNINKKIELITIIQQTNLRVKAELALAQKKQTAHCIYKVKKHFNRKKAL
jgi:hypothetical protein